LQAAGWQGTAWQGFQDACSPQDQATGGSTSSSRISFDTAAAAAAAVDAATFNLKQLDKHIKERVAAGRYPLTAVNWIASIAALSRLVTGNISKSYNAEAARQGVLLTQLPQYLSTILNCWRQGVSYPNGTVMKQATVVSYLGNLQALLSRVSEVREVLGEQQVQQMLQQVEAVRKELCNAEAAAAAGGAGEGEKEGAAGVADAGMPEPAAAAAGGGGAAAAGEGRQLRGGTYKAQITWWHPAGHC
jgi:hypothetical protein